MVASVAAAQEDTAAPPPPVQVLISVADQKLVLLRDGGLIAKYPISTSRFGMGDSWGSYKTPLGKLRVYDKIGDDLSPGAVIKHRSATGEVLAPNAPGRDPIVTRVIWLEGTEDENANARGRGIYIHGTPEESTLGKPVSWGCIRMRSEDVIALYDIVPVGTEVDITADSLPHLHKYKPPQPPEPAGEESGLSGFLAKLLPHKAATQASNPPPQPAADGGEPGTSGLLVKLLPHKDVTQASNPPPEPVAEKTAAAAGKPAPDKPAAVAEKPPVAAEKPTVAARKQEPEKFASNVAPARKSSEPVIREINDGGGIPSHGSDAWRALKGSALLADLPGVSPKAGSTKGD